MRKENDMMNLILMTAEEDDRIRAVILNGSRANPETKKDCFQDYDIVYICEELASFLEDTTWINCFGEQMIMQMPNKFPHDVTMQFGMVYLMQFMDGKRIDLTICTKEQFTLRKDMNLVLLDKDKAFIGLSKNETMYHVQKPSKEAFQACCNEYWWLHPYIAKGIWRDELTYVKLHMDDYARKEWLHMLGWYVGTIHNFTISVGKKGKHLKEYLSSKMWADVQHSYADAQYDHIWDALNTMDDIFHEVAIHVANYFGYPYDAKEEQRVRAYIMHIKQMEPNANEIYSNDIS